MPAATSRCARHPTRHDRKCNRPNQTCPLLQKDLLVLYGDVAPTLEAHHPYIVAQNPSYDVWDETPELYCIEWDNPAHIKLFIKHYATIDPTDSAILFFNELCRLAPLSAPQRGALTPIIGKRTIQRHTPIFVRTKRVPRIKPHSQPPIAHSRHLSPCAQYAPPMATLHRLWHQLAHLPIIHH